MAEQPKPIHVHFHAVPSMRLQAAQPVSNQSPNSQHVASHLSTPQAFRCQQPCQAVAALDRRRWWRSSPSPCMS